MHIQNGTVTDLLRKIDSHHGAIEHFGIEPVPPSARTVRWFDIFSIIINFQINPGRILVGVMAVASGLSVTNAILAQLVGMSLAMVPYLIMATLGVDYGLTGQVATRASFGIRGSKLIPSTCRIIASVYWFAFQTLAGSQAIVAITNRYFELHLPLTTVALCFGAIQIAIAVAGYGLLKTVSRLILPVKLIILSAVAVAIAHHLTPGWTVASVAQFVPKPGAQWSLFLLWTNTALAAELTVVTDASDFCRYSKSRSEMWFGTLSAALVGQALSVALGAFAAGVAGWALVNPFELAAGTRPSMTFTSSILLVIVLDNLSINVLNLYTGGLALANSFERFGRFWATLLIGLVSLGLLLGPSTVTGYAFYVNALGAMFGPLAGILATDLLVIRRMRIVPEDLFDLHGPYWYWHGINPNAAFWAIAGFVFELVFQAHLFIPAAAAMILSSVGYAASTFSTNLLLRRAHS